MAKDDFLDLLVDGACEAIATDAVEAAAQVSWSMCVNAGQESLVADIQDEIFDQFEPVFNGEPDDVEQPDTDHPEAIGIICENVYEILIQGASQCNVIRETAKITDLL